MALVVDRPNFQLDVTVQETDPDRFSVEVKQHWPQAQRPHWRRITQLTMTGDELEAFREALQP